METLLAHVVRRYAPTQWENIATDALHYLLDKPGADAALIRSLGGAVRVDEPLTWQTQVVNADRSRPDLVGLDLNRRPKVMVEVNFGAALTDNQPLGYLASQSAAFPDDPEGWILAFVAPVSRRHILEAELRRRIEGAEAPSERLRGTSDEAFLLDHRVVVITWEDLLGHLRSTLEASGDDSGLRDLEQLSGLCARADAEAMLPLSDEDLDPGRAKRLLDCWSLVDRSVNRMVSAKTVASKTASNGFWGTGAFMTTHRGDRFWFGLYLEYWAHHYPTPFWIFFPDPSEHVSRALLPRLSDPRFPFVKHLPGRNRIAVAIPPPLGVEADQAVLQLVEFMGMVCDVVAEASAAPPPVTGK